MKFLSIGDLHNRVTTPENRIDNFQESLQLKVNEIHEIGKKEGVSAYFETGDFWGSPNPPLDFASKVINQWFEVDVFDALQQMMTSQTIAQYETIWTLLDKAKADEGFVSNLIAELEKMKNLPRFDEQLKNHIPLIGVPGNHELFGNNITTLPKTMLGFMEKLGLIKLVSKDAPQIFHTDDGLTIAVTGSPYHLDIDKPEFLDDYIVKEKLGDYHIHIIHSMLAHKSMGNKIRHTLIDQIRHTKADLTIAGHNHLGFPIIEVDGKYFVNTGAIPRLTDDKKEIERKIKVLLVDITKEKGMVLNEIPLRSAKPGNEVLDRSKVEAKKEKEISLEEFKKTVREANIQESTDIVGIVQHIAENQNLPLELRNDIVDRLSKKLQEASDDEAYPEDAYVEETVLENFQGHEHSVFKFSRGLNIIAGETGKGKSSLIRAQDVLYNNRPNPRRFIRTGADYLRISNKLSNGYIISRYIEKNPHGKNEYQIYDPNTGETGHFNTKIFPQVKRLLGYTNLIIDKDLQFSLNFSKQGKGWFLIGEEFTAPTKAKVIGGIYGTQYADAVVRDLDLEERRINEKIKDSGGDIEKLDKQIEEYDFLEELNASIGTLESEFKIIHELQERKQKIEVLTQERKKIIQSLEETHVELKQLSHQKEIQLELVEILRSHERKNSLRQLVDERKDIQFKLGEILKSLEATAHSPEIHQVVQKVKEFLVQQSALQEIWNQRQKIQNDLSTEQNIIKQTEEVKDWRQTLNEVQKLFESENLLTKVVDERRNVLLEIQKQENVLRGTCQTEFVKEELDKLKTIIQQREKIAEKLPEIQALESQRKELKTKLEALYRTLDEAQDIKNARQELTELNALIQRKAELQDLTQSRKELQQKIAEEKKTHETATSQLQEDLKAYQLGLQSIGKCPTCYGTIDKVVINRIISQFAS